MIWAKILFLSWCKSGVGALFFAWLPFVDGKAIAKTLTVILQARVCGAEQQLPQKSPFLRHVRHVAQDHSHFSVLLREAGAAPRGCLHYICPHLARIHMWCFQSSCVRTMKKSSPRFLPLFFVALRISCLSSFLPCSFSGVLQDQGEMMHSGWRETLSAPKCWGLGGFQY